MGMVDVTEEKARSIVITIIIFNIVFFIALVFLIAGAFTLAML